VADPTIAGLIDEVRAARLQLSADLSAAAAALDVDEPAVASDIMAGDLADLAAFRAHALSRLDEPARRRRSPHRSRRSRALLALPTVPLIGGIAMSAAAALGGSAPAAHHAFAAPTKVVAVAPQPTQSTLPVAAHTTLNRLEQVVTEHPNASQVISVAATFHRQLTRMITTASDNPVRLGMVKQLLTVEQRVLEGTSAPGVTFALAASHEVTALLDETAEPFAAVTQPTPTTHSSRQSAPHHNTTRHAASKATHHHHSAPQSHSSHRPSPSPTPSNPIFDDNLFGDVL
jgi:hypothetical protein